MRPTPTPASTTRRRASTRSSRAPSTRTRAPTSAGPSVVMSQVRDLPQTPGGWFALCAARYFEKFGAGREDLARIAVKNHHNGTLAPKSFLKREITSEDG